MNAQPEQETLQQAGRTLGVLIENVGGEQLLIPQEELDSLSNERPPQCDHCGLGFDPRTGSGGKRQRFCSSDCRRAYHAEHSQRGQRQTLETENAGTGGDQSPPAPATTPEPQGEPPSFLLLASQDAVRITRDDHGNLVIEQNSWPEDDQRILINADYEDRFVDALTDFLGYGGCRP